MRKCANCYFCSTNAFFAVQMIFFWCEGKKILSAQYKKPFYGQPAADKKETNECVRSSLLLLSNHSLIH